MNWDQPSASKFQPVTDAERVKIKSKWKLVRFSEIPLPHLSAWTGAMLGAAIGAYRHFGWVPDLFRQNSEKDWPPFFPFTIAFGFVVGLMCTGFYSIVSAFLGRVVAIVVDRALHSIANKRFTAGRAYDEPETTLAIICGVSVLAVGLAQAKFSQNAVEIVLPSKWEIAAAICISIAALSAGAVFLIVKALKMGMAWLRAK